jgi:hypothetical protein
MDHNKFETPVTVKDDTASAYITLKTAQAASDFLLNRWQAKRTDKHRAALQACSDVIGGSKPVIVARRALVAAVREAGVYVDEKTLAGG